MSSSCEYQLCVSGNKVQFDENSGQKGNFFLCELKLELELK